MSMPTARQETSSHFQIVHFCIFHCDPRVHRFSYKSRNKTDMFSGPILFHYFEQKLHEFLSRVAILVTEISMGFFRWRGFLFLSCVRIFGEMVTDYQSTDGSHWGTGIFLSEGVILGILARTCLTPVVLVNMKCRFVHDFLSFASWLLVMFNTTRQRLSSAAVEYNRATPDD